MPVKKVLTIEVQLPPEYPLQPCLKDIEANLMTKVNELVYRQAKRVGMCVAQEFAPDDFGPSVFRLVVEEQCALMRVTRAQELICRWAKQQLYEAGYSDTMPRVKDGILMVPLRHQEQAREFVAQVRRYPDAMEGSALAHPTWEMRQPSIGLAAKVEREMNLTAK